MGSVVERHLADAMQSELGESILSAFPSASTLSLLAFPVIRVAKMADRMWQHARPV